MDNLDFEPVLAFLNELRTHNNKTWFEQNRPAYEKAQRMFELFTDSLIDEFRLPDNLQDLSAKGSVSRIYRDIRFSKDKSPYKTNMWATIAPGGKKMTRLGYHVAIQPQGQSLIAGGMWEPTPEQLSRFRKAIDKEAAEFKRVTSVKAFVDYFGGVEGERLKTAPQGYERTHPNLNLLQYKQIVVVHRFADQEVLAKDFFSQVVRGCRLMKPFLDYLNSVIQ